MWAGWLCVTNTLHRWGWMLIMSTTGLPGLDLVINMASWSGRNIEDCCKTTFTLCSLSKDVNTCDIARQESKVVFVVLYVVSHPWVQSVGYFKTNQLIFLTNNLLKKLFQLTSFWYLLSCFPKNVMKAIHTFTYYFIQLQLIG